MQQSQNVMDDVQESARKVKELVQKIRLKQINHADANKYENDVRKLTTRWNNARQQIVERYADAFIFTNLFRIFLIYIYLYMLGNSFHCYLELNLKK